MNDYTQLVKRGKEIAIQRARYTDEYKRLKELVDLSKGQYVSTEIVACEACGVSDEARQMVWVQDSDDAPLFDPNWRLALWRERRRAQFRMFYYCQNCHGALGDGKAAQP